MGHFSKLSNSPWVSGKQQSLVWTTHITDERPPQKLGSAETAAPIIDIKINGPYFLVQFQMPTNFLLQ